MLANERVAREKKLYVQGAPTISRKIVLGLDSGSNAWKEKSGARYEPLRPQR